MSCEQVAVRAHALCLPRGSLVPEPGNEQACFEAALTCIATNKKSYLPDRRST
jgi:hypothetical protein